MSAARKPDGRHHIDPKMWHNHVGPRTPVPEERSPRKVQRWCDCASCRERRVWLRNYAKHGATHQPVVPMRKHIDDLDAIVEWGRGMQNHHKPSPS